MKGKIEKELDRLVQQGAIEPICFSEWAAPIVPVLKKDETVRICGDYKLTVNQAAITDSYPLPKINDLFASLAGGQNSLNLIWPMLISKFHWMKPPKAGVEYLGHKISAQGLQPSMKKVRAIMEAPQPVNITQLKLFLGMLNYYGKFLPNL